jgi:hypothetical protein
MVGAIHFNVPARRLVMLDGFIIEELRRREREKLRKEDARRPRLELPLDREYLPSREHEDDEEKDLPSSSVVVIEM